MNNTIKIEFECPEFDSELEINIVIRKDGKEVVVDSTTSSPNPNKTITTENKKITEEIQPKKITKKKEKKVEENTAPTTPIPSFGGNFMNMDF